MVKTVDEKFRIVIEKNTFYFFNRRFEETYEGYLNSIRETLLVLKNEVETKGLKKETFERLLAENDNGLTALLALTGFSNESLKRLITLIRVVDNRPLAKLSLKEKWHQPEDLENIKEWSDATIARRLRDNEHFRAGIVNIFFEGATLPFLASTVPLFELKKLSISKLQFDIPAMIDTLVRYKEKGSYSGLKEKNPETVVADLLESLGLTYETGDLGELIKNARNTKRTMDFIIPNKENPRIIAESSFLVTTSSGQGDKSKTEISIRQLIKLHYPRAKFIGFVDGIGWYVRKEDLKRMVAAYEDVFTFHRDELARFENLLRAEFGKNA
ncbi:MAG: DpnII family type II restriction endonuclease [Dehalococcoidia bacterium]|nr:DpnII family type II restriction endonuclease [Dehalococcoidia bacterium]